MKIMSLLAGIILLFGCLFEITFFANEVLQGNVSLTNLEIGSFYSPVYILITGTLAAWFFVDFATRD